MNNFTGQYADNIRILVQQLLGHKSLPSDNSLYTLGNNIKHISPNLSSTISVLLVGGAMIGGFDEESVGAAGEVMIL